MWLTDDARTLQRLTLDRLEAAICDRDGEHYVDHQDWAHQCHSVSLEIVRSDLFTLARVARGSCRGVTGQHSWVVLGDDCYDPYAPILDATLWSYQPSQPVIWRGRLASGLHHPHGEGSIYQWGRPAAGDGEPVTLAPSRPLSAEAQQFLAELGPLDPRGWAHLCHAPVEGWPSREIVEAILDTPGLRALVPIDIAGMLTDRNPGGLYLREPVEAR